MKLTRTIPGRIGALVGDCVQNFRAALDHTIWERSRIYSGHPVSNTQFPIFSSQADYLKSSNKSIHGLSPALKAQVGRLQPFHAGDAVETHPLSLLADLSNVDKHRAILLAVAAVAEPVFSLSDEENIAFESTIMAAGAVRDGEVLARVRLRHIDSTASVRAHLEARVSSDVMFSTDGPGRGLTLQRTLAEIRQFVAEALVALNSPYLT